MTNDKCPICNKDLASCKTIIASEGSLFCSKDCAYKSYVASHGADCGSQDFYASYEEVPTADIGIMNNIAGANMKIVFTARSKDGELPSIYQNKLDAARRHSQVFSIEEYFGNTLTAYVGVRAYFIYITREISCDIAQCSLYTVDSYDALCDRLHQFNSIYHCVTRNELSKILLGVPTKPGLPSTDACPDDLIQTMSDADLLNIWLELDSRVIPDKGYTRSMCRKINGMIDAGELCTSRSSYSKVHVPTLSKLVFKEMAHRYSDYLRSAE